jgi:protein gp37
MSLNSIIEWTGMTLNCLIGCSKKSLGCMNCYAIRVAWRLMHNPNPKIAKRYEGTVTKDSKGNLNWTGRINFDEEVLLSVLNLRRPLKIFVNSESDLFHPNVKDEWLDKIFGVMAICHWHVFQILTKHPDRALAYLTKASRLGIGPGVWNDISCEQANIIADYCYSPHKDLRPEYDEWMARVGLIDSHQIWPLPNVWIGTSAENQPEADKRLPFLLQLPAAVRFVSAEPLLGPLDLCAAGMKINGKLIARSGERAFIDWVIVGGESGPPVTCPDCGAPAMWIDCELCQGAGLIDCWCEGAGGDIICSQDCFAKMCEEHNAEIDAIRQYGREQNDG